MIALAKNKGYQYIDDRKSFDGLNVGSAVELPLLGLIANTDVPYEVDRQHEDDIYPSLAEMAETALKALSAATKDSDKGFFIMIEGSRIDHAGHANDPLAQVHEVLAYDKAVATVLEFLEKDSVPGVMVSTSDHETGGLAAARQLHAAYPDYLWYPGVLANGSQSAERLAHNYHENLLNKPKSDQKSFVTSQLEEALGIYDYSDDEVKLLLEQPDIAAYTFADIVSRRAQTGWSTHAADVNIYASSAKAAKDLVGNHENTEVGDFLRNYLDVDVDAITKELKQKGTQFDTKGADGKTVSWMGRVPATEERLDGQDHLEHYAGDHKRHKRHVGCDCGL
ncbi:hypothetical protein LTS18_006294 [Coniosporium uncinatum]|uniref:Uncharacterized protein n=1 Tax=Coniosporium uncinatum TaxID=93489 RepID=A0ACC3DQU9_9PEZI|nr:hypothetical protein LTS18_006294 [Coniosporium uncinatum]